MNRRGATPLHIAAEKGDIRTIVREIRNGSAVDARDYFGWTPLMWAARNNHLGCAKYLIRSGADMEAVNNNNWSPLASAAVRNRCADMCRLLINMGANDYIINRKSGARIPIVNLAIKQGRSVSAAAIISAVAARQVAEEESARQRKPGL